MRIAILTQQLRYNFGGILQNYALQTVLRRMGHEVVTLDPPRYHCKWWWQYFILIIRHTITRYIRGRREIPIFAEWFRDKEIRMLGTNTFRFINQNICRKEYWDLAKDIKEQDFDAFIVGSDQTWRYQYNYSRIFDMFLCFTKGWNVRRIAYAASFGIDEWEGDSEITKTCSDAIKHFDLVTVREYSGIDICRNVFNIDAQHVLDPTLLLKKEDYVKLLKIDKIKKSPGNLLVYILDYTDDKRLLIEKVTKQYGLTPFRVNSDFEDRSAELDKRIQPPVEQWLRGFYDADYVITDSFHACVFSIIFKKPFVVYGNIERGLSRVQSLLAMLDLEKCIITRMDDFNRFQIYSQDTEALINEFRTKSFNLLANISELSC